MELENDKLQMKD